jgi:hypothetical protein
MKGASQNHLRVRMKVRSSEKNDTAPPKPRKPVQSKAASLDRHHLALPRLGQPRVNSGPLRAASRLSLDTSKRPS